MKAIVLAPSEQLAQQWQYAVEDLGADWRCSPATSADQALAVLAEGAEVLLLLPGRDQNHVAGGYDPFLFSKEKVGFS